MQGYVRRILLIEIGGSHGVVVDSAKELSAWRNAMVQVKKRYGYNLTSEVTNRQLTIYRHKPERPVTRLQKLIEAYPFHKMTNGQRIARRFTDTTTARRVRRHCYEYAKLSGYKFRCQLHDDGLLEIYKQAPFLKKQKGKHTEINWNRNVKDADYRLSYMQVGDSLSIRCGRYTMLRTLRHKFMQFAQFKRWVFKFSSADSTVLTIERMPNDIILRRSSSTITSTCKYPFAAMKVGDYVTFKTKSTHNARNAAYMIEKRNPGRKYKVECMGDTVIAWRLS